MTGLTDLLNRAHGAAVFSRRIRVLAERISEHLDSGTALDVGCGDGSLAKAIEGKKKGLSFVGVDVFLRPTVAIEAKVYDGVNLPFPDHSFDWVTICDVLHHTDDAGAVLRECLRVSRRGVVIKDHLRQGLLAGPTLRLMDWVGNVGHGVRLPYNYLSPAEWRTLFQQVGTRVDRWDERLGIYPVPFSLLFDRKLHFIATVTSVT